jgi:hypothetical protein
MPYRTPAPSVRPVPAHVRVLAWFARGDTNSPHVRRAQGGPWELRWHYLIGGAPQVWRRRGDKGGPQVYQIVKREEWL